jgi:hypothetical protein
VPKLGKRQPQPAALLNERQDAKDVDWVYPVAGLRTTWGRKDAAGLIEPQGLAAQPAPRRDLTDE